MDYITLGRMGLRVSVAGLGAGRHSWLGQKTKRGFYDYRGEAPVPTR